MAMLDDSPAVWKWESRQQARDRARSQIQTIGEAVAPHVASGDFGAAQQALAQATQPAAGTPTPWTKMISDNLKAKLGGAMDAGQAAATRPQAFEGRPTDTGGSDLSSKTLAAETLPQTLARKARQDRAENPNDSGLMSSLSDAAGGVNQLFSGRKFVQGVTQGRVDTADLPGPILPAIADMGLAPATIATAGFGGAAAGAGAGGKVVAANLAKKWAADTAIATTGALAAQKEGELQNRFAQSDLPGADIAGSKVAQLAGSTAAFVGGAVAAHKFGPTALRAAASAPEAISGAAARAGIVPEGGMIGGGAISGPHLGGGLSESTPVRETGRGEIGSIAVPHPTIPGEELALDSLTWKALRKSTRPGRPSTWDRYIPQSEAEARTLDAIAKAHTGIDSSALEDWRKYGTPAAAATTPAPMDQGFATVPHSQITERPDLFQARDVPEGQSFDPAKVKNIVQNYDPLRMEPGLLVHDTSTGDLVVARGHHRLESLKQLSAKGQVPDTATWQTVSADLSDPAQVQALRKQATLSNYGTAQTNLREDLRATKVLLDGGADVPQIQADMRVPQQRAEDLVHMNHQLPPDLIDKTVRFGKNAEANAAEIARAAQAHGFNETDVRAMFQRYVGNSAGAQISRTQLRNTLDKAARLLDEAKASAPDQGFGALLGDSSDWAGVRSDVLDTVDQIEAHQAQIQAERARLSQTMSTLGDFEKDPEAAQHVAGMRAVISKRIAQLKQDNTDLTKAFQDRQQARFEGTTVENVQARDILKAANAQKADFLTATQRAARDAGAGYHPEMERNAVKGLERTTDKLKQGGKVTDALRSTVTSDDPLTAAERVQQSMQDQGWTPAQRLEDKWTDRSRHHGYGDVSLKLQKDGVISEILVMPQWMLDAKGHGHDLYEQWRALPKGPKKTALEGEMRQHYIAAQVGGVSPAATALDQNTLEAARKSAASSGSMNSATDMALTRARSAGVDASDSALTAARSAASNTSSLGANELSTSPRSQTPPLPGDVPARSARDVGDASVIGEVPGGGSPISVSQPPTGRDGPRVTTAADGSERQVPARGNALAAQALEQKQVMTTPQGRVSRAVDSTPIIRRIAAAVNPARDMPENIVTAYRAEGGVGSMLRSKFSAAMADPTQTLAQALADNPPEYIGPAGTAEQMALVGTAKDVLDRPEFYRIQPKLRAAMNYYDRAQWDHVTAPVRAGYNVDVQPYSGNPGSVYTPTMVARGSDDERIAQAMQSLASKANAKTRLYESAWDRVGSNPEFKPETDLRNLTDAHSKAMARNASNETFKLGAGGKTGTEVAEELHPELLRMKNDARTGLANLQAKLKTATADQQQQIGEFRKTQTVINRVNDRMEPLQARVDALGEEYGPELSYLSGQVRELQLQKTALQAALQNTGQKVVFRGTQTGALMDAIDKAQTNVAQLVKSYANAATDPYVLDRSTFRYYTPEAAKAVTELKRMPTGFLKSTIDTLDEIRAWHFSGDASPLTIQGQLGALADPISTARTVQNALGKNPLQELQRIAKEQPQDVADFSFSMNRPFGEIGPEFRQPVGLAHIPGVGGKLASLEQNMFALVERQTFDMWKKQRDDLMAHGMEKNGANHAAAAVTQQVIPSLDPTRRAISPLRAGAERAAFTSVSFATSPALMLKDATVAIAKLGTARTVNPGDAWAMLSPREQLALKRTLTTAATVGTISAASAAASAESRGLSVKDAILQTFDPRSRYFAAVQLGGGRAIPIGGPMRGFLKALAPSEFTPDKDGLPMAGLWDYTQGKLNSAPRIVKDLVQNSDYNGNKIMTGTFGQRVLQSLWYAGENVAPMTAGQTMTDTRQGNLSAGGTLQRVASQLAGTNYSGPSPTEQLNQISRSQGHGDFYSADPSVQQAIKQANPALWQEAVNAGSANRQKAEGLKKQTLTDQQGDDDLLLQGKLDVSKWASSADTRKTQLTGAEAAIYQDSPATSGAHPILDQFYQQIDASKVNGEPDMNAVYAWVAEQSPAAQKYIADNTGLSKTPVQKLRTNLLDEYYALPKYHGYSADEATQIDDVLAQARNNAKGTNAANNQVYVLQALRNLKGVDPDTLSAARKVVLGLVKETTDRARWTKAHPESVIMYGQGKLTPEQIASVQKALKAP